MTAAFTIRLDDDLARRLDELAKQTGRSRSWLAAHAIEDYVKDQEWQMAQILEGIDDTDAGRFATEAELDALETEIGQRLRAAS